MVNKYVKYLLIILISMLFLVLEPAMAADEGDILVHLRLYEGSRGNEVPRSSVVSSYYLKPLLVISEVSEFSLREEKKELKRIFNLKDIKLMTRTQLGWKHGEPQKRFQMMVLNGHEFLVQLTMKDKKNSFHVEVKYKGKKGEKVLFETGVVLPEKKSLVFGFEDLLRKPFFICLQREEDQSVIDKEVVRIPLDKRPKLINRVKPQYPEIALKKKIQGEVILDATTDEEGNVSELYIIDGVEELNKAAFEAVKQWKYEPYVIAGKARPVRFTVIIYFNLPGGLEEKPENARTDESGYTGELMDFHFENADLFDVLRVIARKTELNIVVDPGIKGKVSCKLEQVPWDRALELMLQMNGLDMILNNNVLRILKADPANKHLKKDLRRKKYTGEPMEFNFKNTVLEDVLNIIAKMNDFKLELEPGIKGRVTCQLEKVRWDQALDLILQLNGLEMIQEGKVLKIFKTGKVKNPSDKTTAAIPKILPTRGYLADVFGNRKNFRTNKIEFHNGIDIAAKMGNEVIAAADGVVTAAEFRKGYGNLIIIDHGNGYVTRYGELSAFKVKKGQKVTRNQVVGLVGNSGSKGEPHLHYEVRYKGKPINPLTLIRNN